MKISKNKKMRFFLMSQGSLDPKIRFLGQRVCSVAREQTHRHKSEYRGHPFRVSGIINSTYHQGSVQLYMANLEDRDSPTKTSLRARHGNLRTGGVRLCPYPGFNTRTSSSSAMCSVNRCSGKINCWSWSSVGSSSICSPDIVT